MADRRHLLIAVSLLLGSGAGGQAQETKSQGGYRQWLERDVAYIITSEEEAVFKGLSTAEEKEVFVEQFWKRRDPTPATEDNEFKVEHYRRIAYAGEAFAAGIPGWRTDRGRTYIVFGPPDELDNHAGGSYSRRIAEGGGGTSVFPFERWYYRHLPGVGTNVELEFVDDTGGGLYRLAMDEHTKDALFYTPTSGLTLAESIGLVEKSARVMNRFVTQPQQFGFGGTLQVDPIKPYTAENAPFERLYRLFDLQKPPRAEFRDLRDEVLASVSYQQLSFEMALGFTYVGTAGALVPLNVELDTQQLTFREAHGIRQARVSHYVRIESVDRQTLREYERQLVLDEASEPRADRATFQNNIPLKPGLYKMTVLVKDDLSGKAGVQIQPLRIPVPPAAQAHLSSIFLARAIRPLQADDGWKDDFTLGQLRVQINASGQFRRQEPVGIYVELYGAAGVPAELGGRLSARLVDASGTPRWQVTNLNRELSPFGARYYLAKALHLGHLDPGPYRLILELRDATGRVLSEGATALALR